MGIFSGHKEDPVLSGLWETHFPVAVLADIPEAGVYTLEFRYRTSYATAMALSADGSQQTEMVDLPDTDNGWATGKVEIELPAGVRTIRLAGTDAWSICLNWLRLNK